MRAGGDSPAYQLFMLALCVYALAALGVEAAYPPESEIRQLLSYADTAVCVLFLTDFCVSLYRAEHRWRYFYTWGWLDLLSSIPTLDAARWGRAARIARIVRVLRGIRATRILTGLVLEKRRQSGILAAALLALLLLTIASISILHVETEPALEHQDRGGRDLVGADDDHDRRLWRPLSGHLRRPLRRRHPDVRRRRPLRHVLRLPRLLVRRAPTRNRNAHDLEALRQEIRDLRASSKHHCGTRPPPRPERTPQNVASE